MKNAESLGDQSSLMLASLESELEDAGEFLCIRTPNNPSYMWGNYLHFRAPPTMDAHARWTALYRERFPKPWFMTFSWPGGACFDERALDPFLAAGFFTEDATAFVAQKLHRPERFPAGLEVRPVLTDVEWLAVRDAHIRILCTSTDPNNDGVWFAHYRFQNFRRSAERGFGHTFAAYLDGQLIGQLGIFTRDGLARFQEVMVHPEARGRGLCRAMCFLAAQQIQAKFGPQNFVTVADDPMAIAAYRSIGFEPDTPTRGLRWYDSDLRPDPVRK